MPEPFTLLALASAVVGLLPTAGKVATVLSGYISTVTDAPRLAHAALVTVNDMRLALVAVEHLLQTLDNVPPHRRDMVQLDHLVFIFTHSVLTFSELEALLRKATVENVLSRLRWSFAEKKIQRATELLEKHTSSILLILNILQCESNIDAQASRDELHSKLLTLQEQNNQLVTRLTRLEAVYNDDDQSVRFLDDDRSVLQQRRESRRSWSGAHESETTTTRSRSLSWRPRSQASFEQALAGSRVYLRSESREMDASISSSVTRSNAWTVLGGLSLNAISTVSVFALPLTLRDINAIGAELTMASFFVGEGDGTPPAPQRLKCVLVGPAGPKTKLCNAMVTYSSAGGNPPTFHLHDDYKTIIRYCGRDYEIVLQDSAGTEAYDRLSEFAYDRADVVLICGAAGHNTHFQEISNTWAPKVHGDCWGKPSFLVCVRDDNLGQVVRPRQKTPQILDDAACAEYCASLGKAADIGQYMTCDLRESMEVQRVFQAIVDAKLGLPGEPKLTPQPRNRLEQILESSDE